MKNDSNIGVANSNNEQQQQKWLTVLGDDPGSVNYGRSLLQVSNVGDKIKFKLVGSWLVTKTIRNEWLKGTADLSILDILKKYRKYCKTTLKKHGPFDIAIAERFMPRGGTGTVQGAEVVSFMLGQSMITFNPKVLCKIIPAVTWKTQIKRYYSLDVLYGLINPCPNHLLDSVFIALYAAYFHYGIKPFSTLTRKDIAYIISHLKRIGVKIKIKEDKLKAMDKNKPKPIAVKSRRKSKKK